MGQDPKSEGVPHDNVSLFAARGNEPMFVAVDETIDALLMKVECLVLVRQLVDIVDMDKPI